jgi:hypothetical protein
MVERLVPNCKGFKADEDGNLWTQWYPVYKGFGGGRYQEKRDEWRIVTGSSIRVPGRGKFPPYILICEAFHGLKPSSKHECCHKDDNHENSRPDNLYWGLHIENINDASINGKLDNRNYSHSERYLDDDEIEFIRSEYATGKFSRRYFVELFCSTDKAVYNATKDIHLSRNLKNRSLS